MKKFILIPVILIYSIVYAQNDSNTKRLIINDSILSILQNNPTRTFYKNEFLNRDSISQNIESFSIPGVGAADEATKIQIVNPSPNSSVLTNLVSENVDLYTGKASVNLPLFTVKCNSISLPITLQSTVGSHKVNDFGTWVGLGWNLNAGGTITRVMKNLPDEFTGIIATDFNIPGYGYLQLKTSGAGNVDLSNFDNLPLSTKKDIIAKSSWTNNEDLPSKGLDLSPDEFYFNFADYSGKFVFDQDGNVNLIPKTNLNITPAFEVRNGNNTISGFIVIDDKGYKYEFGNYTLNAVEETKFKTTTKSIIYSYRAFQYFIDDPNIYYDIVNGLKYYVYERYPYIIQDWPFGCTQYIPSYPDQFEIPSHIKTVEYCNYPSSWLLTKITSPTGDWISFSYIDNGLITYESSRSFSANIPDLAEKNISQGNVVVIKFLSPLVPFYDQNLKTFFLPVRHTFSVNYYNIQLKSKKISSINTSEGANVIFNSTTLRNDFPGDKRLDFIELRNQQSNLIKKIKFAYENVTNNTPLETFTFSYQRTQFNYYPNTCTYAGMSLGDLTFTNPELYGQQTKVFPVATYNRTRMYLKTVQEEANGQNIPAYQFEYENPALLPFRTSVHQDKFGFANNNSTQFPFTTANYSYLFPYVQLVGQPSPSILTSPIAGGLYNHPVLYFKMGQASGWPAPNLSGYKGASFDRLRAGVLKKITYPTGGYKEFVFGLDGNPNYWNGIRILEVNEYENPSATPVKKTYTYGNLIPNDDGVLKYSMVEALIPFTGNNLLVHGTKRMFYSSEKLNPENTTKGAYGGYEWAEISQINNGKIKFDFFTPTDIPDAVNVVNVASVYLDPNTQPLSYLFPFPVPNNFDWKRGLPKSDNITQANGLPLKTTIYNYFDPIGTGDISIGLTTSKYNIRYQLPNSDQPSVGAYWLLYAKNTYSSTWYSSQSVTEKNYDQNGSTYSENIQTQTYAQYIFNGKKYLFNKTKTDLKNSRNEQTIQKTHYPLDYPVTQDDWGQGIANLKAKNVLNAPIEQYTYLQTQNGTNFRYINGVLNKYHIVRPLVKDVFKLKTNGLSNSFTPSYSGVNGFHYDINYKSEMEFSYDATGHIVMQNKTNDIKESYKWSYNNMYPVAKVINAFSQEFDYTSFEPGDSYFNANAINDPAGSLTGKYYRQLPYYQDLWFGYIYPNKEYKCTFWSKGVVPALIRDGFGILANFQLLKSRNGWNFYQVTIPAFSFGTYLKVVNHTSAGNNCYIDEIRLYPSQSQMTTYTFNPLIGMTSESDVNGKTTYYEYDGLSRLTVVKNDNKHIVKTICYNYAGLPVPCAVNPGLPCTPPVINSLTQNSSLQITVSYSSPPGATSCRIDVWTIDRDLVGYVISPACGSPVSIGVPRSGLYEVTVTAYAPQCPNKSVVSEPVRIKVRF